MPTPSSAIRLFVAACTAVFAFGLAACGDDAADTSANATKTTNEAQPTSKSPATDEGQIKALIAHVQEAFTTGDGKVVCEGLTARGQRDILAYGDVMGIPGPCADVVAGLVKRNRAAGIEQEPVRVVSVRVNGSRAVALIRVEGVAPIRQRYRKIDGEWKIGSFGVGAAVGGDS